MGRGLNGIDFRSRCQNHGFVEAKEHPDIRAGKPAPTGENVFSVGAGSPALDVRMFLHPRFD